MRILLLCLLPLPALAQFTYVLDQSIPVTVNDVALKMPWAGGFNSPQVSTMDLNGDSKSDIVIFDKTTSRISTFIYKESGYQYAPQYEVLFPEGLSTFVLLRDFNGDEKKDLFTFGQIGIHVYQQITVPGKPFGWKKLSFFNAPTGLFSEVLLTKSSTSPPTSPKFNLLPGSNDLPDFTDVDGDGDLDVLNMRFVSPNTAEYHKNFSMERYGIPDSLDLERVTNSWGGFLECSCSKVAFQGQTCEDIGGRINHTGGKAMLSLDTNNDGDLDLLFTEETCNQLYHMENIGTAAVPVMDNLTEFPPSAPVGILSYPSPYLEDVDHDGKADLLVAPNLSSRNQAFNDFRESLWLYRNTSATGTSSFTFSKTNFLQEDMIELGDLSAPAFADMDLDGDLDMVVGSYLNSTTIRGVLAYYENTGTPSLPSYQWVTDDFANVTYYSLYNIRPQFVDIDKNGSLDLAFTASNSGQSKLYYVLSSSTTAPLFNGQALQSMDVPIPFSASASLVDVDLDGHLDVLVGVSSGALVYYRNNGSYVFSLGSDAYLGLGPSTSRQYLSVASGDLDGNGQDDLITGDYEGNLVVYPDFRTAGANPEGESNLILDSLTQTYIARRLGGSIRPAIANIFGVTRPSIVIGNRQGGLHLLRHDNSEPLSDIPSIVFYPNPVVAGGSMTILSDRSVTIEIFTVLGVRVGASQVIPGNQPTSFPLQGIASGLYIARFTAASKSVGHRFIIH
ncbi:MAG: T9SS type A sorting domain-containing protein [Cyclobacteriaceae bacterium]|nr:T9SS type A sorting domain-containing protein [Cyclobacteriaceae bacterium]